MSLRVIELYVANLIYLCHDMDYGCGLSDSTERLKFLLYNELTCSLSHSLSFSSLVIQSLSQSVTYVLMYVLFYWPIYAGT